MGHGEGQDHNAWGNEEVRDEVGLVGTKLLRASNARLWG